MGALLKFALAIFLASALFPAVLSVSTRTADLRGVASDVKYIRCETCEHIVKNAIKSAEELSSVSELALYDVTESICQANKAHGKWLARVDLVERVGHLHLVEQDGQQLCKRECKTLALACNDVMDGVETELAEKIYAEQKAKQLDVKSITAWFCDKRKGVSEACRQKAPLLPKDREKGPEFEKMDEKEAQMSDLLAQMRGMNGGNDINPQMFSKDELGQKADEDADADDDDDDDGGGELSQDDSTTDEQDVLNEDPSLGEVGEETIENLEGPANPGKTAAGVDPISDEL